MAKVVYVQPDGEEYEIDLRPGQTVMEGALWNDVPGIDADCGGSAACGTCHVHVAEEWLRRTGSRSITEDELLELSQDVRPTSRLSCQIVMTEALDGLRVEVPEQQYR